MFDSEGDLKIPAMYIQLKPIERGYVMAFSTGWIDLYNIYLSSSRIAKFTSVDSVYDFLKKEIYLEESCKSVKALENKDFISKEQYNVSTKYTATYYMIVKDERFGIINNEGELLIKPECVSIIWVKEKFFIAEYENFFKIYDNYGKMVSVGVFSSINQTIEYTDKILK